MPLVANTALDVNPVFSDPPAPSSTLDGCSWDAIEMVPTEDVASRLGTKFQF